MWDDSDVEEAEADTGDACRGLVAAGDCVTGSCVGGLTFGGGSFRKPIAPSIRLLGVSQRIKWVSDAVWGMEGRE
jgi:hypothetical protein